MLHAAASILLLSVAAPSQECAFDEESIVSLTFEEFDQDIENGWQALRNSGCDHEAIEVIRLYRSEAENLSDGQRSILLWHEGKLTAVIGDYRSAIPLLLAGVPINDRGTFTEYALGTVAFLRRDRAALEAARDRLAALPRPQDWVDSGRIWVDGEAIDFEVPWPPNLHVLDGLLECFDLTYREAIRCRPLQLTDPLEENNEALSD